MKITGSFVKEDKILQFGEKVDYEWSFRRHICENEVIEETLFTYRVNGRTGYYECEEIVNEINNKFTIKEYGNKSMFRTFINSCKI